MTWMHDIVLINRTRYRARGAMRLRDEDEETKRLRDEVTARPQVEDRAVGRT